ncbi:MAG: hypothetical protein ACLQVD_09755 [Capsulimonadaceae bacterium]
MNPMYGYSQPAAPTGRVNFDWIGQSWKLFQEDPGPWIAAMAIYGALYIAGVVATEVSMFSTFQRMAVPPVPPRPGAGFTTTAPWSPYSPYSNPTFLIYCGCLLVFVLFAAASMLHMAVKKVKGELISLGDAFSGLPYMGHLFLYSLPLVGLSIVISVAITPLETPMIAAGNYGGLIGLILLMSLFNAVMYAFLIPGYAMVCDGIPAGRALAASIGAMKSQIPITIGLLLVIGIIMVISMLPCFLGLLATYPMMFLVFALAYRDIIGMPAAAPSPAYLYGAYGAQPQPGTWPPPPTMPAPPQFGAPPYGQNPGGYPQSSQPPYGAPPPGGTPYGSPPPAPPQFDPPAEPGAPHNPPEALPPEGQWPSGGDSDEGSPR